MSRSTISTFKLFEMFPNEHSAREYGVRMGAYFDHGEGLKWEPT